MIASAPGNLRCPSSKQQMLCRGRYVSRSSCVCYSIIRLQRPSGDEELPPRKKARKERAARSIKTVDPLRAPIIEAGYAHVRLLVQTSEAKVWLDQQADLAEFSQDAFEYGVGKLGLRIDDYDPVTTSEQDLVRRHLF
jgi:hypothetical protein